jgi:hypothetical protein
VALEAEAAATEVAAVDSDFKRREKFDTQAAEMSQVVERLKAELAMLRSSRAPPRLDPSKSLDAEREDLARQREAGEKENNHTSIHPSIHPSINQYYEPNPYP